MKIERKTQKCDIEELEDVNALLVCSIFLSVINF